MDMVSEQLIIDPDVTGRDYKNKHAALSAVAASHRKVGLRRGVNLQQYALFQAGPYRSPSDFVVFNGQVVKVVHTWSFQVPNQDEIVEQIKLWDWTVNSVRNDEGSACLGAKVICVPRDIPRMKFFASVKANAWPVDKAQSVAQRARVLLASTG